MTLSRVVHMRVASSITGTIVVDRYCIKSQTTHSLFIRRFTVGRHHDIGWLSNDTQRPMYKETWFTICGTSREDIDGGTVKSRGSGVAGSIQEDREIAQSPSQSLLFCSWVMMKEGWLHLAPSSK